MTSLNASTEKKLIESRLSNDMEPASDPKGKNNLVYFGYIFIK